jgi:hypothetical protein
MCYTWAGEGLRPLDPRTKIRRDIAPVGPGRRAAAAGPRAARVMSARVSLGVPQSTIGARAAGRFAGRPPAVPPNSSVPVAVDGRPRCPKPVGIESA